MATLVQNPPPSVTPAADAPPPQQQAQPTQQPQQHQQQQHHHHGGNYNQRQQFHHHQHQHHRPHHHHHRHPNFQHHHNRQHHHHHASYTAAVPMIFTQANGSTTTSTNLFKQINIIPGLDAENAIVDTGVRVFRPNTQVQTQTAPAEYDGKRMRRSIQRRTVDYNASTIQLLKHRLYKRSILQKPIVQCDPLYYTDIVQPRSLQHNPVNSVTSRFVRASTNKVRCPVFTVAWTPEGRRVLTGTSSGEFTLWNGLTFNFETILQAHDSAVRAMEWSHNDMWLLSGDHNGIIKYWQSNMNNVKLIQAHNDPIRGLSFCPTDNKFVTCSDDGLLKVWDFYRCLEERVLRGHGADVKCVGWHPSKSLVASGSKDSQQPLKLWDPRSASSLATIHSHKSTVMDLHWNSNGNWLLSGSRDRLVKVFDIRTMKEISTFRGHKKEAASVNWHPIYEKMFASGGSDGSIMFWLMGCEKELGCIEGAHDGMIWDLKWHPLGHILCTGSNDHTTKFWTRNRPGDKMRDKYNLNVLPTGFEDDYEYEIPNTSQSELDTTQETDTSINENSKGEQEQEGKPDLNSPVVKALLEQSTLEVSKPKETDVPAQIYTFSRSNQLKKFRIDPGKQRRAIEEAEKSQYDHEIQMEENMEKTRNRRAMEQQQHGGGFIPGAPSLLTMDVPVPDFLEGEYWDEGEEPSMHEAKRRYNQRTRPNDDGMDPNAGHIGPSGFYHGPDEHFGPGGPHGPPPMRPPFDGGRFPGPRPRFDGPPPPHDFHGPPPGHFNEGEGYDENWEGGGYEPHPPFQGQFQGGPRFRPHGPPGPGFGPGGPRPPRMRGPRPNFHGGRPPRPPY